MNNGGILIIDDDPVIRHFCKNILQSITSPIHEAETAEEGLKKAASVSPDIILLDIGLPDQNGLDLLDTLRRQSPANHFHTIILTADSDTDTIVKALENGAIDYVKKPFIRRELVARVKNLYQHQQYEKIIAEDLATGAAIQKKFLTPENDLKTVFTGCGYNIESYNRPCTTISGDFFYPVTVNDNSCGLFFGDTCGHGLSAALISMRIIGSLHTMPHANNSPANHLQLLNEDLQDVMPTDRFIAACYAFFMRDTIIFSNAGQPYPIKITENSAEEIEVNGYPLGQLKAPWYTNKFISMAANEKLLFYSDGIVDALDQNGICFGKNRLLQHLKTITNHTLSEIIASVTEELEKYCSTNKLEDDISIVIVEKESQRDYKVTIPNNQHAIGEFIEQFRERVLQQFIISKKERDLAEYVLMECLDNAWEHGNGKSPDLNITLNWSITHQYLKVSVTDQGSGFEVSIPDKMPPLDNPRGRGLFTLNSIAEELLYNAAGNKVTFKIKR